MVGRLNKWLVEQGLSVDLLAPRRRPESATAQAFTEELRALVLRCVAAMTAEELAALSLPSTAVLRVCPEVR